MGSNDRYQIKIRDKCGQCDGNGEFETQKDNPAMPGWKVVENHKCTACGGTGYVDERWISMAAFRNILERS